MRGKMSNYARFEFWAVVFVSCLIALKKNIVKTYARLDFLIPCQVVNIGQITPDVHVCVRLE